MTRVAKNSPVLLLLLAAALAPLAPPLAGQTEQVPFPRLVATIDTGEDMPVVAAWSPDSERLAYGTEILVERKRSPMAYGDEKFRRYYPGEVWLVTLAEMEKKPKRILRYRFLRRVFGDFSYTVNAVSWSPDGSKLALELTNEKRESAVFFFTTKGKRIKLSRRSNFTFGYGGAWLADNESYYAAQVGSAILGGGGLTSRLSRRVRTQEGLAYSVASVWTMPTRSGGIIAATTSTRAGSTVETIRHIAEVLGEVASAPPEAREVGDVVDRIANGFVFKFETSALIVSRQMLYLSQNLPLDWLQRFLAGIQGVTPDGVHEVFRRNLPPNGLDDMVIVIVGDPASFDPGLEDLGPVRFLEDDQVAPRTPRTPRP